MCRGRVKAYKDVRGLQGRATACEERTKSMQGLGRACVAMQVHVRASEHVQEHVRACTDV